MNILGIDPGPTDSGYVIFDTLSQRCLYSAHLSNIALGGLLETGGFQYPTDACAIEMVASYGMAVGRDVFDTCRWVGRYEVLWSMERSSSALLVYRSEVKMGLCGSMRAKDANIRQALIDLLGAPGTKKNPGATYGIHKHGWSALAVAVIGARRLALIPATP